MPILSYLHQLFNADTCHAYIHTLQWKDRPLQCPRCRSHESILGASTTTDQGVNAPGATAACAPSTISPTPCCTRASGRCRTGFWRLFCCVSPVRRVVSPGSWASISVPAIAGAGGCAMPLLSYEMHRQLEGTVEADDLYHTAGNKGQSKQGGKKSLGRRARGRRKKREPGRGHYDKDRPAIIAWVSRQGAVVVHAVKDFLPSARCRRRRTWRSTRAVGSIRTRPAAIGRSACFPCSNPTCGCFVVSANTTCRDTWASFNSYGTFVTRMRSNRPR